MYPWGQYPISRELPLPGPWSRYVTPTCLVQATGDQCTTAMAVPAPSLPVADHGPVADPEKPALRRAALARRKAAFDAGAGAAIAFHFLAAFDLAPGAVVAGYVPMGEECDVAPLLAALAARGHALALPVVVPGAPVLTFRRWTEGAALEAGVRGTRHPAPPAAAVTPQVLLVPLLAIDDAGIRLGYGKGYYDLTIAALRRAGPLLAVGVGFAAQRVARLPRDPWDVPLDAVVCEDGVRRFA